jgi:phage tail-like protein
MTGNSSDYLKYLPATLQADEFVDRFLLAFEQILTGRLTERTIYPDRNPGIIDRAASNLPGLETVIDSIHTYFNPDLTPDEFLPWLANWVALSLREDWQSSTKREFIKKIVPLYRLRGTKEGLEKVLSLYLSSVDLPEKVIIYEEDYFPEDYFQVELTLPKMEVSRYWQQVRIAKAIIDREKPAHTYYGLKIQVPSMQITGNVYGFEIEPIAFLYLVNFKLICTITVKITRQTIENIPPNNRLRVSIKGGMGTVKVYSEQFETGDFEMSYQLSEKEIKMVQGWYVAIDNLSDFDAKGLLSITTTYSKSTPETDSPLRSVAQLQNHLFFVQPGLRIPRQEGGNYVEGNTLLGTVRHQE